MWISNTIQISPILFQLLISMSSVIKYRNVGLYMGEKVCDVRSLRGTLLLQLHYCLFISSPYNQAFMLQIHETAALMIVFALAWPQSLCLDRSRTREHRQHKATVQPHETILIRAIRSVSVSALSMMENYSFMPMAPFLLFREFRHSIILPLRTSHW